MFVLMIHLMNIRIIINNNLKLSCRIIIILHDNLNNEYRKGGILMNYNSFSTIINQKEEYSFIDNEVDLNSKRFDKILESIYSDYPVLKRERDKIVLENKLLNQFRTIESDHMRIDLVDDETINKSIKLYGTKEVTSPIHFDKGGLPNPSGLFSEVIFGTTQEERTKTIAYIDLKNKYFHPYLFEILIRLDENIDKVAKGIGSWEISKEGKLIKNKSDNEFLEENNTGLRWLINNFDKLKFEKNESIARNNRIDLIESSKNNGTLLITKFVVIPIIYRDIEHSSTRNQINPINEAYGKLISLTSSSGNENIGYVNNMIDYKIQSALVSIRKFGQSLIEKKNGFFHKAVLGKNPDYGARSVISVPVLSNVMRPDDNPIDTVHTGIPISQCCSMAFPLIKRWIMEFFRREFEVTGGNNYKCGFRNSKWEIEYKFKKLDNPMEFFNSDYIYKMINLYSKTYSSRFDPIPIPLEGGETGYMVCEGRVAPLDGNDPLSSTISKRFFTWTDLLFIACTEALKDKHIYLCRYPFTDYLSMFPNKVHVLSTLKTFPAKVGNVVYKHYPVIDPNVTKEKMNTLFNDTTTMSNTYLKTLGADYDGDMVSIRMVFSEEANIEAHDLINSIKNYFTIEGEMIRVVENELYLTFYNMSIY